MIKRLVKIILLIIIFAFPIISFSQSNDYKIRKCSGYQRDSCRRSQNIYYKVNSDSRSALFIKGQKSRTHTTIYNGRDYRFSLCWDNVLGSQLQMKIIDVESNAVLYDNATDEFASEFEFTAVETRNIVIEILALGSSALIEAQDNPDLVLVQKDKEMGCVGVLIEHMITPSKGF